MAGVPPHELREHAHAVSARLLDGDLEVLPSGIAILAMTDGGAWFMGRHYHVNCRHDGSTGRVPCRNRRKTMPQDPPQPLSPPKPPGEPKPPGKP